MSKWQSIRRGAEKFTPALKPALKEQTPQTAKIFFFVSS
jgi:hypothetical protein